MIAALILEKMHEVTIVVDQARHKILGSKLGATTKLSHTEDGITIEYDYLETAFNHRTVVRDYIMDTIKTRDTLCVVDADIGILAL